MIGGTIIEIINTGSKIWINCKDDNEDTCAIYVEKDAKSRSVSEGDKLWWQSNLAMWTPRNFPPNGRTGVDYDIQLKRIGFSGVARPETSLQPRPTK